MKNQDLPAVQIAIKIIIGLYCAVGTMEYNDHMKYEVAQ